MVQAAWRRLFMVPVIIGTYFWAVHLFTTGVEVLEALPFPARENEALKPSFADTVDVLQRRAAYVALLPVNAVARIATHPAAVTFAAEYGFLCCYGTLLLVLLFSRRGGGPVYALLTVVSGSAVGLALCNYVLPMISLPSQAFSNRSATKNAKLRSRKHFTAHLPTTPLVLYSAILAVISLGLASAAFFSFSTISCIEIGVLCTTVFPLILVSTVVWHRAGSGDIVVNDPRMLLWGWVLLGAVVSYATRMASGGLLRGIIAGKRDLWGNAEELLLPVVGGSSNVPALGYLAFAAQVGTMSMSTFLFSLFDEDTQLSLPARLALLPLHVLAPTLAVPLTFALRGCADSAYDTAYNEVLQAEGKKGGSKKKN